jgi:hypothetical protein
MLTAVWSFWFAAAFLELPGAHACPVHDSIAQAGAHAHHHHGSAPGQKGQHCSCLGQCCCGSSPAVLATPSFAVEAKVSELPRVIFRAPTPVFIARAHAQPFANGPPVA